MTSALCALLPFRIHPYVASTDQAVVVATTVQTSLIADLEMKIAVETALVDHSRTKVAHALGLTTADFAQAWGLASRRKAARDDNPARDRALLAYELRVEEVSWADIADLLGYETEAIAQDATNTVALAMELAWPPCAHKARRWPHVSSPRRNQTARPQIHTKPVQGKRPSP